MSYELLGQSYASFSFRQVPALWLLGSSPDSCIWAAELGLPYVFADFINPDGAMRWRGITGSNSVPSEFWSAAACSRGGLGDLRGNRCGGGATVLEFSHDDDDAVPGSIDRGAHGGDGASVFSRTRVVPPDSRPDGAIIAGSPRRVRAAIEASRRTTKRKKCS